MPRRRDPLRAVLRMRGIERSKHEAKVAEISRRLGEVRSEIERRESAQAGRAPVPDRVGAIQLRAMHLSGIRGEEMIALAREELDRTRRELEVAQREWAEASAREKSAQRLDGRRAAQARYAALRASQKSLDELALLMWNREATGAD